MSTNSQSLLLADTLDFTRGLSKWYLSLLRDTDMKKVFEINGHQLNSPIWIAAHLAWAENMLVLKSTGGKVFEIDWLNEVGLGAPHETNHLPETKEVLNTLKAIHEASLEHITSLTDEQLDEPNLTGINFGGNTKKRVIQHAIRHEGTHAGHLSWICKLQGIMAI